MAALATPDAPIEGMAAISIDPSNDFRTKRIFDHFDVDKDGILNFDELNALQTVTSGVPLSKKQWKAVCGTFGINPNKSGLTIDHIMMTYQTNSANLEEDFQKVFNKDVPFSPNKSLIVRSSIYYSNKLNISKEKLDISSVNPALYINTCSIHTNYYIPNELIDKFNKRWRAALHISFTSKGQEPQLLEWLSTGKSNGKELKLQLLAIPPNHHFKLHCHPNIEFEMTLAGTLHEVKLLNHNVAKDVLYFDENEDDDENANANANDEHYKSMKELNLNEINKSKSNDNENESENKLMFKNASASSNQFISNSIGSIHQSYTSFDGALILVLWSGCHANIQPNYCNDLSDCEGTTFLKPGAGWT